MKHLALVCLLSLAAAPAFAQEAPSTATATQWNGLPVSAIIERMTAAGLTVAAPQTNEDRVYLVVQDGPLRWVATLFSCTDNSCPDVQFTAAFSGPNATPDIVSRWNGERRFVKAFYAVPDVEGGEGRAVAQYDLLLNRDVGASQLDDPIQIWRSLAIDLGRTVSPPPTSAAAN
jgi:hypothetical protein